MSWGTLGASLTLEGASSRAWNLRFERRLAPNPNASIQNPASSVWLVRDEKSGRLYAAKRQLLASLEEVDALVDEAAAWRAACLADNDDYVIELVDVFVERTTPMSVSFLAEFCARGKFPKKNHLSEPVLLTIAADLSAAAATLPSPHAHIAYESLLVDANGRIRLSGFGAHRSAILRDNPGLAPADDSFDIGLLLYELMFGGPPPDSLQLPENSPYSPRLLDLVQAAFSHVHPRDLNSQALSAGAEERAPVINLEKKEDTPAPIPVHVERATERNVEKLLQGEDIGTAFAALLGDLNADPTAVPDAIFSELFKKPMSKDPICAMRALTMLHNLILDGPPSLLDTMRKNDKFMDWTESSWTREAVEGTKDPEDRHPATFCFAGGELAFYAAILRRKARFHQLSAGGFTGRWDRTGAVSSEGRDVITTRKMKVVSGMADIIEMTSELGCRIATTTDEHAAVKQAALGAMVSECCLAFHAAFELANEVLTVRAAEKLVPGIGRLYTASRTIVFAVERVPSAGGEQYVEQFAAEYPPDIVESVDQRVRQVQSTGDSGEFPTDGWDEAADPAEIQQEADIGEENEKAKKKEKKKKKKEKSKKKKNEDGEKEDITAADGALVVHGADGAAEQVKTMFGNLLSIDETKQQQPQQPTQHRPFPNMSHGQALAAAFGVPEEIVGGQYAALPAPEGYGDDDYDDEGGYDDFRAREQQRTQVSQQAQQGSLTAKWAARSGYGGGTLVVSDGSAPNKSHPVFCQCAQCEKEEAEMTSIQQSAPSQQPYAQHDYSYGQQNYSQQDDHDYNRRDTATADRESPTTNGQSYGARRYDDADADSLDDEDDGYNATNPEPPRDNGGRSLYDDDYDSYESVTYSVDDKPDVAYTALPRPDPYNQMPPPRNEVPQYGNLAPKPFSIDPKLKLNIRKLRTEDKISEGTNAIVYKGQYNREVAVIKKLSKKGMESATAISDFVNEVKVITSLSHPRILTCLAASIQRPNYVLATEFVKRGSLFDVLHKNRIKLSWALIRKIAIQMAEGMAYMHEQGFLHRDMKTLNIFIDGAYNIKIGDFGHTLHMSEAQEPGISGTYQYMAPEVLRGEPHTPKSDVFSYAQILCECVSGMAPFQGMDARTVAEQVVSEDIRPPIPPTCQRAYVNLIQMCWSTVPSTRPSFAEVVELINSTTK